MALSRHSLMNKVITKDEITRLETFPSIPLEKLQRPSDFITYFDGSKKMDQLASEHLGDGRYWWVICMVNGFKNPLQITIGTVVRIPDSVDRFFELIKNYKRAV